MTTILWLGSEQGDWETWFSSWDNIGNHNGDPYARTTYRCDDPAAYVIGFAPAPQNDGFAAGYFMFFGDGATGAAGIGRACCEMQDDTGQGWIRFTGTNSNGQYTIDLWDGAAWNSLGAANLPNIGDGGWFNFAVSDCDSATADVIFQLNGITLFHDASVDMSAVPNLQFVKWGYHGGRSDFSEYAMSDTTLVGHRTKVVGADANGAETDGSGAYTDINEQNINYSDFWALPTAGDARSVKASARTLTNPAFKGVSVTGTLMRVDASGPQNAKPFLRISGTNYYGDTFALTTGWLNYQYVWQLNPATTAAWTASEVNDATMEWGWEAVA